MPRNYKTWIGLFICIVIGAGWIVSLHWSFAYTPRFGLMKERLSPRIVNGRIIMELGARYVSSHSGVELLLGDGCTGLSVGTNIPHICTLGKSIPRSTWPRLVDRSSYKTAIIPLWTPLLLAAVLTTWSWRTGRIPPGHCQQCGYSLTANTTGQCPECGKLT